MNINKDKWAHLRVQLGELFFASFGKEISQRYLDWRYYNGKCEQLLFQLEFFDDLLVASYSMFPVNLVCDGQVFKTAMSMTTMTHPAWQGRGLFQKLATNLYKHSENLNIAAVWGFPNVNSHQTFNTKLGWSDIYEIPTLRLEIGFVERKTSQSLSVARDDNFLLSYPIPPKDGLIRVNRTVEYLKWRYLSNPVNSYKNYVISQKGSVSSYMVTKLYGDELDVVDIQASNLDDARALMEFIIGEAIVMRLKSINCWAPTHHFLHGVLERLGFKNSVPVTYFGGRILTSGEMPLNIFDYRKWYVQMGDSDVY